MKRAVKTGLKICLVQLVTVFQLSGLDATQVGSDATHRGPEAGLFLFHQGNVGCEGPLSLWQVDSSLSGFMFLKKGGTVYGKQGATKSGQAEPHGEGQGFGAAR